MEEFDTLLEEKTDYELIEIYSNAPDYQPEFIEQVKAHIVKRKIPLNTLLSLSEDEIKQLKTKPADGIAPPLKTPDDNPLHLSEINANILSIKNNVRFFFWLTIIGLVLGVGSWLYVYFNL
tara:strand:- start:142 stop:504 length:363 start_codon:yes stop_codon:yes gene_type:complete